MVTKELLKEVDALTRTEDDDKNALAIELMISSPYHQDVEILKVLIQAYIRDKKYPYALAVLEELRSRELDEQGKSGVMFNLAIIMRFMGNVEEAINLLEQLVKVCEKSRKPCCYAELSYCYLKLENKESAEDYAFMAAQLAEENPDEHNQYYIYNDTAWIYRQIGKPELAIDLYQKALRLFPINKNTLLGIGDCYDEINDSENAKLFYLKCKKYYSKDWDVQDYVHQKLEYLGEDSDD